jgi:hypothetical protein
VQQQQSISFGETARGAMVLITIAGYYAAFSNSAGFVVHQSLLQDFRPQTPGAGAAASL